MTESKLSYSFILKKMMELYFFSFILSLILYNIIYGSNKMFFTTRIIDCGIYTILSSTIFIFKNYLFLLNKFIVYIIFSFFYYVYLIYFIIERNAVEKKTYWVILENGKMINKTVLQRNYENNSGSFHAELICLISFFIIQIIIYYLINQKIPDRADIS